MGGIGNSKERMITMFKDNLVQLRKMKSFTQEDIAEMVGVSRQSVAKWESGESIPDLEKSRLLARALGVSLDELVNHQQSEDMGFGVPPKGKYLFGVVTVGDKGQIVIPAKARKVFDIKAGDQLVVLGDDAQGMAIIKAQGFLAMAETIKYINRIL